MIPRDYARNFKVIDVNIKNHPDYQKLAKEVEELKKLLNEKKSHALFNIKFK